MTRSANVQTGRRSARDVARFSQFCQSYAMLAPAVASPMIAKFASGQKIVVPSVSAALSEEWQWTGHEERASLIAEYGLFGSVEEATEDARRANAPLIAERRKALSNSFLDYGATASARADELAADLSITVTQAIAILKAEQPKSTIPSIEERSRDMPDMGGTDVSFLDPTKSHSNNMSGAIDRAAGIKKEI